MVVLCVSGLCLLAVVVMYLMWVQVLNTLERFALHRRASTCPSYHLSVQHGPSFLLAPVGVFFSLLAGLLFVLLGRSIQEAEVEREEKIPEPSTTELWLETIRSMLVEELNKSTIVKQFFFFLSFSICRYIILGVIHICCSFLKRTKHTLFRTPTQKHTEKCWLPQNPLFLQAKMRHRHVLICLL